MQKEQHNLEMQCCTVSGWSRNYLIQLYVGALRHHVAHHAENPIRRDDDIDRDSRGMGFMFVLNKTLQEAGMPATPTHSDQS